MLHLERHKHLFSSRRGGAPDDRRTAAGTAALLLNREVVYQAIAFLVRFSVAELLHTSGS
jgi:hypothetical protein